jgi:predicted GTPase
MADRLRYIILGAAGRDFHDFQTFFRDRAEFRVVAFTATQIPFIENRAFPKELAGPFCDADIPSTPKTNSPRLLPACTPTLCLSLTAISRMRK